jgi:hypothetical protein
MLPVPNKRFSSAPTAAQRRKARASIYQNHDDQGTSEVNVQKREVRPTSNAVLLQTNPRYLRHMKIITQKIDVSAAT